MQAQKMQVQVCPQLTAVQDQLKTLIASHQMVFGNYQKDPKNAVLKGKLEEMQLQIRNLSDHQKQLVQQFRGQVGVRATVQPPASAAVAPPAPSPAPPVSSSSTTPVLLAPSSVAAVAKPLGSLSPRPHLVTLPVPPQSIPNLGIVVPLAHVQAQPALMSLPGILNQPNTGAPQSQTLVNLQLVSTATNPAAAILTPPTPASATPVNAAVPKQNQASAPSSAATLKLSHSVLQPIQPRRASPPIKVPQFTITHPNNQGQHGGSGKGVEKSNGVIYRSLSDSDAKDLKKTIDSTTNNKDPRRVVSSRNLPDAEKKKMEFMAWIGLVTHDALKELQSRRVERKRRSTANPHYSYTLENDKRRSYSSSSINNNTDWVVGGVPASKRPRGRPTRPGLSPCNSRPGTPDSQEMGLEGSTRKEEVCAECGKGGQLLLCTTCSLVYHLDCLSPPLVAAPAAPWSCPACIVSGKGVGTLSNGALTMVNSYIASKANKEDERRKLQRRNADLLHEKQNLQEKAKTLKQQIEEKRTKYEKLTEIVEEKSATVETLNNFIKTNKDPPASASST